MNEIDLQIPIERLSDIDSTNAQARRAVESGELGDQARMFVAEVQSAGSGRFGRSWASPRGGLWCTLAWPVNLDPARVLDGLGLRLALACLHALEHTLAAHGHGEAVRIKWPNDLLVGGKKVLGVLTEVIEHDGKVYVLVGVGVNGNFPIEELPSELHSGATTLQEIVGGHVNLERLLVDLRVRLRDALMEEGLSEGALTQIRQHIFGVGKPARITLPDRSKIVGVLKGLNDEGRLLLDTADGEFVAPPGAEIDPGVG